MPAPFRQMMLATLLIVCCSSAARAQDFRGAIAGTITDATGGVLPGATVTVTNVDTGVRQVLVTGAGGEYRALYLNSGPYTVSAELSGFKKALRSEIVVRVGDALTVNITLEAGAMRETVEVSAAAPLLETSSISGTTIDSKQIAELPLAARGERAASTEGGEAPARQGARSENIGHI